jgi:hypothetical protein
LSTRGNIVVIDARTGARLWIRLVAARSLGDLVWRSPARRQGREILPKRARKCAFPQQPRDDIRDGEMDRSRLYRRPATASGIQFRDGKRRPVRAADLVSGALIANIVSSAVERACVREVETGEGGLRFEDVANSMAEEFDVLVKTLTPANCRHHLTDLPQDMDVVSGAGSAQSPVTSIAQPTPSEKHLPSNGGPARRITAPLFRNIPRAMRLPKLCGADIELGNFIAGFDSRRRGALASAFVAQIHATPGARGPSYDDQIGDANISRNGGCIYMISITSTGATGSAQRIRSRGVLARDAAARPPRANRRQRGVGRRKNHRGGGQQFGRPGQQLRQPSGFSHYARRVG